jgi:thiol reductant ABC exporter CydC subunit
MVLAVLLGATALGCAIGLFAASGYLIARAAQHPSVTALTVAVVAVRALAVGRAVFRYLERLVTHDVALRGLADVRVWFYRRLERLLPAGLWAPRSGDLVARLVSDVDTVQDLVVRAVVPIASAALVVGGVVAVVLFLSAPAAALLAVGLVAAGVIVPVLVAIAARRSTGRIAAARGRFAAEVTDDMAGAAEVTAFTATDATLARVDALDADLTRLSRREATHLGLASGLNSLAVGLTVWLVLLAGVLALRGGSLGPVALVVLTLTALAAFEAVQPLPAAAATMTSARAAAARIFAVTDAADRSPDPTDPVPVPEGPVAVTLTSAKVRYGDNTPWALDGVSLELRPGRRVALVGPNGAGKSTVIALLLRLVDLGEGSARLGAAELSAYAADDVRRVICGVTQDPYIFATTLAANLRIGRPDATDDEVVEAAATARLLDWVDSLPHGWSTELGAGGVRVSGGERQRIALARALLADPQVLVLDEPTAHLDDDTRIALTADLLAITRGRSTLLATHDLTGLGDVDEIVVLDRGRVVQRGTYEELVALPGTFRQMSDAQVGTANC